jgi:hypothetical protein
LYQRIGVISIFESKYIDEYSYEAINNVLTNIFSHHGAFSSKLPLENRGLSVKHKGNIMKGVYGCDSAVYWTENHIED